MKTRYLVMGTVFLVGMLAASAAMAACIELKNKPCVTGVACPSYCTPQCGFVAGAAPIWVEKCCNEPTGHYNCHKNAYINCYVHHHCEASTTTCPTDALEKKCKFKLGTDVMISNWKKRSVSGVGCS